LITNFYGSKYSIKNRVLSITDTNKKKAGIFLFCITLILTVSTSIVFAANISMPEEIILNLPEIPGIDDISENTTPDNNDEYYKLSGIAITDDGEKIPVILSFRKDNITGDIPDDMIAMIRITGDIDNAFKFNTVFTDINGEQFNAVVTGINGEQFNTILTLAKKGG
jgi:hypothetical protein